MLRLQVQVYVSDDQYKSFGRATSDVEFAKEHIGNLGYYSSTLASILGDTMAAEIRKALALPAQPESDDDGE